LFHVSQFPFLFFIPEIDAAFVDAFFDLVFGSGLVLVAAIVPDRVAAFADAGVRLVTGWVMALAVDFLGAVVLEGDPGIEGIFAS
jgi:hypothetical protein